MIIKKEHLEGAKYFMCVLSQAENIPYIDTDLRKIIWGYTIPFHLNCKLAHNLVIKLYIDY